MDERVVYLNGDFVPEHRAVVSVFDRAISAGDGIYDVGRSFGHAPDKFDAHARRLVASARYTRIELGMDAAAIERVMLDVFERNRPLLAPDDDYIVWIIATRGAETPTRNPLHAGAPTVVCYCLPPNYHRFAKFYRVGAELVSVSTRRTPADSLDPRAKITNKMNHIQAEFEARAYNAEAFPLMLAADGTVAESSAANLFFVRDGRLFTPRRNVLLGIMRENVIDLAPEANVEVVEGDFLPYDLKTADEIFLTTTSFSILPVSRLDGRSLPESVPGPVTRRLMNAWKRRIGVDFIDQALAHLPADDRRELG